MLLVIDIGNSNIVTGVFNDNKLVLVNRIKTDHYKTVDEYLATLMTLWQYGLGKQASFKEIVISSVVPPLTGIFHNLCKERLKIDPLIVGPGIKTGLVIRTVDPSAVGADRIVNSVAVKELYGIAAIVIDFGTATTFDVLDTKGAYCGGAIAPGLQISLDALVNRTSKLPKIEAVWPEKAVGNDTVTAMRSGCILGYDCMVDGLVQKIKLEVEGVKNIVATGGLAQEIASHLDCIDIIDPDLTLKGLQIIAGLNSKK